jgi:hypothetical protein
MRKPLWLLIILMLSSHYANAGAYSITIQPDASIDADTLSLFNDAVNFWESKIIGTQEYFDIDLKIDASTPFIDGVNGVLGSASTSVQTYDSVIGQFLYSSKGVMRFDVDDVAKLKLDGTLFDVILHEMAHVIGFGTLWNPTFNNGGTQQFQNVYINGSGQYTGAYALAIYQEIFNPSVTHIPVELDGGSGTANAHWDEGFLGNIFLAEPELLTGYLHSNPYISDITLASFADLGYIVRLSDGRILGIVSSPSTFALFGLALFVIIGRRFTRDAKINVLSI